MKRKFMALFISFAMIFSAAVSIPAKVFAEGVDIASFSDFGLNDDSSVEATWDKKAQTLTVKGNGKIDINKWVELARKFSVNNYNGENNGGWNTNSDFTLEIADKTIQFPDDTVYVKDYIGSGFFQSFKGEITINKEIDTSNVTNMTFMFDGTTKANPDVSKWDTSNVTDMSCMFTWAINANPDVSNWKTDNLTDISNMFNFSGAKKLDLSNWDVSKITINKSVFEDTSRLEFLSFKGLPEKHKLMKFSGSYKVDVLKADGTLGKTEGPFEKDKEYEFNENTGYRVYLAETAEPKVKRIFGNDRYETAVKSSQSLTNKSDKVFVASGISMIDALNVGPYAGRLKAPVLLTGTDKMDEKTLDEIKRLKAKEVVIIGGVNAVSENVENQLKSKGLTVNRIFGESRYETALKVSEEALNNGILKSDKIFLCSGISPADALSIASVAAKEEGIILLSDGNRIVDEAKKYIKAGVEVKIIGGVGVISDVLKQELESTGATVERIFGNDRYETSVKVYEKYYKPMGIKTVYLANGLTMADALTGAGVAYNSNTGLLLTSANEMINPMKKIIKKMDQLIILGGNTVVNDNIWK